MDNPKNLLKRRVNLVLFNGFYGFQTLAYLHVRDKIEVVSVDKILQVKKLMWFGHLVHR